MHSFRRCKNRCQKACSQDPCPRDGRGPSNVRIPRADGLAIPEAVIEKAETLAHLHPRSTYIRRYPAFPPWPLLPSSTRISCIHAFLSHLLHVHDPRCLSFCLPRTHMYVFGYLAMLSVNTRISECVRIEKSREGERDARAVCTPAGRYARAWLMAVCGDLTACGDFTRAPALSTTYSYSMPYALHRARRRAR